MFLKFIYLRIIFEKLYSIIDDNNDKFINRDEFGKASNILEKIGLIDLKFEDMDLDKSNQITIQEMMKFVIKNIETLEINSGDLNPEEDEYNKNVEDFKKFVKKSIKLKTKNGDLQKIKEEGKKENTISLNKKSKKESDLKKDSIRSISPGKNNIFDKKEEISEIKIDEIVNNQDEIENVNETLDINVTDELNNPLNDLDDDTYEELDDATLIEKTHKDIFSGLKQDINKDL